MSDMDHAAGVVFSSSEDYIFTHVHLSGISWASWGEGPLMMTGSENDSVDILQ